MHKPYLQWAIIGHYDFLLNVRERILSWCGVELAPPRLPSAQTSFLYRITTSGKKAEVVDRVLNSSGLGLPRKHLPGVWERYKARVNAKQNKDRTSF